MSYTIGLSISTLNNPFFVTLRDGAQAAADALGVDLVVVDSQDDPATEASNMEDLIAQGVDVILVNPTDSDAIVPSILAANDAGIPVFTIDRGASGGEVVSHIASDNVAGGRLAGAYVCDALGGATRASRSSPLTVALPVVTWSATSPATTWPVAAWPVSTCATPSAAKATWWNSKVSRGRRRRVIAAQASTPTWKKNAPA
jgi:ABC-type sugar transport system substrate-binding protein